MAKFLLSDGSNKFTHMGNRADVPEAFLQVLVRFSNNPSFSTEGKERFILTYDPANCSAFIQNVDPREFPGMAVTKIWAAMGHGEHRGFIFETVAACDVKERLMAQLKVIDKNWASASNELEHTRKRVIMLQAEIRRHEQSNDFIRNMLGSLGD